ncbi:hypothetical protein ABN034_06755 [Actinopolymorpha sp. B11F2]|uniref:hypothetical protein n=1 Tax=Actinopolymorpha sp. B11F2 TaxID=3160862 RepID=UPI0032E41C29
MVGDEDGVAVIPRAMAEEVTDAAEQKSRSEESDRAAIATGTWDRTWLDTALDLRPPSS